MTRGAPRPSHVAPRSSDAAAAAPARGLDPESSAWLSALDAGGPSREDAIARLHDLLLRAALFEIGRPRAALAQIRGEEVEDLALQAAGDALVAVLAKRDEYQGRSRFTTWAYKFALLETSVRLRRRAWRDREVPLEAAAWRVVPDPGPSPHSAVEEEELVAAMRAAIATRLTPHQRNVLLALAVNGVPIDVLSERLGTTRGALYKTLHDARRRLRAELAAQGLPVSPQGGGRNVR